LTKEGRIELRQSDAYGAIHIRRKGDGHG